MNFWGRAAAVVTLGAAACGGGGGGSLGGATGFVEVPFDVELSYAVGSLMVNWTPSADATSYRVYWSMSAGLDPAVDSGEEVPFPPYLIRGLPTSSTVHVVVTAVSGQNESDPSLEHSYPLPVLDGSQYEPAWADVTPARNLFFTHDSGRTDRQNGADLAAVMESLQPGDHLEVGGGTYVIDSFFDLTLLGTAEAPIWIVARSGETPVLTRSDALQDTVSLGVGAPCEYACLRGLEITGGNIALRLRRCEQIWIDRCHIHDCAQNAIDASTADTSCLYFTRNEVHDTGGFGEGIYIGRANGQVVSRCGVIANNHVYNTGGTEGDGIEVRQGSYGYWIAENRVHDTPYPCILVYGTGGRAFNLIERNLCYNSGESVMQVQGEAIVRNNVLINGVAGFSSFALEAPSRDLTVVHNTILNSGTAVRLNRWAGRPGMVFANNVAYSQGGEALRFASGSAGVTLAGNVLIGTVTGADTGYSFGVGLTDFVDARYDASAVDVTPSPFSALLGAGSVTHALVEDFYGSARSLPVESGAVDVP